MAISTLIQNGFFNTAIPDATPAGIFGSFFVDSFSIPTGAVLSNIEIRNLNITHTFDGDLDIFLIDPDGNQIELSTNNGGGGDNYTNTTFSDLAAGLITGGVAPFTGSFRPEQALSSLAPGTIAGNWRLKVVDESSADTGTLQSADLAFIFNYNSNITGTAAKNTLIGGDANDKIKGLGGNDLLAGQNGSDVLTGGRGKDLLLGGDGKDFFDFNSTNETGRIEGKRDVILDFTKGQDKIDLKTIDANSLLAGNQAFKFIGTGNFHNVAGELRFVKVNNEDVNSGPFGGVIGGILSHTVVEGDINGDGKADFQIQVYKDFFGAGNALSLAASDFIL